MRHLLLACVAAALLPNPFSLGADGGPYVGTTFRGRIAYSADGNHNDPDDWIASPTALAIFAETGLKDRLVHFDYNCILPLTDPDWEKIHAESVQGAVEKYGYDRSLFHDCRKERDAAIADIARAIDASSADDPLYFIIAGPMEIPYLGIQKSDPAKRKFVHCISHSRWNDGFASKYQFTFTKRSVIEQGIHWVQIADQNRLLSFGRFGTPSPPEEFRPYFWMRDSKDAKVRFLWDRMVVSTRPDPSDAGMAYFLANGDEQCDPAKLKRLLEDKQRPAPTTARKQIRIEAENFRVLDGFTVEDRNDRNASHRLQVKLSAAQGAIRTPFAELYAPPQGTFDIDVRFSLDPGSSAKFNLSINGTRRAEWTANDSPPGWQTQTIRSVPLQAGDEITLTATGAAARLDYVQFNTPK